MADKPFYYVTFRDGRLESKLFGPAAAAKPEDKVEYVFAPSYRDYLAKMNKPK